MERLHNIAPRTMFYKFNQQKKLGSVIFFGYSRYNCNTMQLSGGGNFQQITKIVEKKFGIKANRVVIPMTVIQAAKKLHNI